jgi:hypothetical protein
LRLFRPRFHLIKRALLHLDVTPNHCAEQKTSMKPRLRAWVPDQPSHDLNRTVSV